MNTHAAVSIPASQGFAPIALGWRSRQVRRTESKSVLLAPEKADALVERLFFGDAAALEELKLRFAPRLCDVAIAILGDGYVAEKIVDRIFDEISLDWPPPRGEVQRWLTRLVRREARRRRAQLGFDA